MFGDANKTIRCIYVIVIQIRFCNVPRVESGEPPSSTSAKVRKSQVNNESVTNSPIQKNQSKNPEP